MPFAGPVELLPAEMLRNVSPPDPMVVFTTFSAVPVSAVIVLAFAPVVTPIVPPPVALKPTPLVVVICKPPPAKLIVAPVLLVTLTAVLEPVVNVFVPPLNVRVPPVLLPSVMPVPPFVFAIEPAYEMVGGLRELVTASLAALVGLGVDPT